MKNDYTKIGIAAVLFLFLIFVVVQIVEFSGREHAARGSYYAAKAQFDQTTMDEQDLKEDFDYYSNPTNLSKEMRSRFSYALPGEKTLILVQEGSSTESGE
jgi:hypothetical protein